LYDFPDFYDEKQLYSFPIMIALPDNIKIKFFKTLNGDTAIEDFEQWVYGNPELESILGQDDYLNLISLNYKKSGAKYELLNLIEKLIDKGEYETYKMLMLLQQAKQKDEKLPYYLMEFYDLYCKGYDFLYDIGLGYGLSVVVPPNSNSWDDLTKEQQERFLAGFSPGLDIEIQRLTDWIKSKKIILTGKNNEYGDFEYDDYRSDEEKKSLIWTLDFRSESENLDE